MAFLDGLKENLTIRLTIHAGKPDCKHRATNLRHDRTKITYLEPLGLVKQRTKHRI